MNRPLAAAFAMSADVAGRLFTSTLLGSIDPSKIRVLDSQPMTTFTDARANGILARTEILITGWGCPPLTAEVLDQAPMLQYVLHAAGTVKDHITEEVWDRGIQVSSAAVANSIPVAEYTLAMILLANKKVLQLSAAYAKEQGALPAEDLFPSLGNYRKTVGVIGASKIGRLVLQKLHGFDFHILITDPYLTPAEAESLGAELTDLETLLANSDVISLNAPDLPDTQNLLNKERLGLIRPGATLINTARGALVDHEALRARILNGDLYAILDVTTPWVLPPGDLLYNHPNVLMSPHIAGSMGTELERLAAAALDEAARAAAHLDLRYPVAASDLARTA
ncbi:hydroxyacid dehydrogenase [Arthrobacter sp. TS-15]|uniref:hydroxyacid dehydrogenase n=1 Tax=unclassified Arthrobacter TaxID=235627 RepID=UPI00115D5CAB|nr:MULTISPECIES: hydroxyacid dehydrogenase [unclassified Arthrobacter]TQS91365.1 hydroxyacid dehydrogenase [Arthrobacter sp. TS-15]BCW63010.1 glycerate dehydrogenase [Arthrobacter sp. StoSoilB22]